MAPEIHRSLVQHSRLRRDPHTTLRRLLDRVSPGVRPDQPVKDLEARIADLLGKPAALFFPTGTMAQQVALRIHAERTGRATFAAHPTAHVVLWEQQGYNAVHHLVHRPVGDPHALITTDDLAEVKEPVSTLLLELPQREAGGLLPEWDDLVAQTRWAAERGTATHMDGARLWEAQPYYDRPHAEIAALFDTVYVSLYKGLEGVRGAILAGDRDTVDLAAVWRARLGGNTPDAWPLALAADLGLDETLPHMPAFLAHARAIAAAVNADGYARTVPEVPQTPLFHIHLPVPRAAVQPAAEKLLAETGIELPRFPKSVSPTSCALELSIGHLALDFTPEEVAELIRRLR